MDDLRFPLHETTLWTRDVARPKRAALQVVLAQAEPGQSVVIDAEGLKAFDHSFASELFSKTLRELPVSYPGVFLVIEHLGEFAAEQLEVSLDRDKQILMVRTAGGIVLIGSHHPIDQDTVVAIASAGPPVTAAALSVQLAVSVNAMNERLAKLVRFGLVRRTEEVSPSGRKHFVYQTARPAA